MKYPTSLFLPAFRSASLAALFAATLATLAPPFATAAGADDTVLLRRGDITITRADFDAELLRVPEKDRVEFAASPRRNRQLLERMLAARELAAMAREKKLDEDPVLRYRMRQEEDRLLANALIQQAMEAAALEFEQKRASFERRARELYDIDKAKYALPETVMITLAFFGTDKDGAEGARRRAEAVLAKVRGGTDLGDLVASVSDDSTTRDVRGRKGPLARTDLDTNIANAVFSLDKTGDTTDVIKTREGFFIVRLDERKASVPRSFDEVKGELMAGLKQRQIDLARDKVLDSAGAGKSLDVNQQAIDALRVPAKANP
jgi:peptidyl-prolyl cis-trans isomerase C